MWIEKIAIGDLVISKQDGIPGIILDKQETARSRYGDIVNRRYKFKVYLSDGDSGWVTETSFRALYKLP
tara:strand:+ start:18242 stop:18448 length:207 start_codon:yes stop_codon:yes gene_type:complete